MAEITASLVKDLRERTGVGMMDCKKALAENAGDIEASIDWLRSKGLAKAAKKAGRVAAEGLVGVATSGTVGGVIELNSETDFVARNEGFQNAAAGMAKLSLSYDSVEGILAAPSFEGEGTVNDFLTNMIATIGENMGLRRVTQLSVTSGAVAAYTHGAVADGLGRIGVLVAVESTASDTAALVDLGRKVAMHVAATNPLSLSVDNLDPTAVERERSVFTEQARESGKPEAVIEKMIEGRLRKFYEEVVLLKQAFVMDPDKTVQQVVDDTGKALGAPVAISAFAMFKLGDGIEKKEEDFAAEVAAVTGQA
jgi:elongation factor Ts